MANAKSGEMLDNYVTFTCGMGDRLILLPGGYANDFPDFKFAARVYPLCQNSWPRNVQTIDEAGVGGCAHRSTWSCWKSEWSATWRNVPCSRCQVSDKRRRNLVINKWSCALDSKSLQIEKVRKSFSTAQLDVYTNTIAGVSRVIFLACVW